MPLPIPSSWPARFRNGDARVARVQGFELKRGEPGYSSTATLQPDASATLTIKGTITGGTGAFRGASGKSTTSASSPNPLSEVIVETEGTISY